MNTHETFWRTLMRLRLRSGLPSPQTPAQADADYEAAAQAPLAQDRIDAIIRGTLRAAQAGLNEATMSRPSRGLPCRALNQRRWIMRSASGLAATIAIAGLLLWACTTSSGPAWADVTARLAAVRNVAFWMEPHSVNADGRRDHLAWFREYHQDPGLMRREYCSKTYDDAPKPPDQKEPLPVTDYQIRRTNDQEQNWYFVSPDPQNVLHEITYGNPHDKPFQVQDWWNRLQEIRSDAAKMLGEETLNGKPSVVFEASVDKLWGYPSGKGAVTKLRIWVDKNTSLPARVQFTGKYPDGTVVEQTMEDMRWNLDLPTGFFTPPAGCPVVEGSRSYYLPEGTRLKSGIRARLYGENGFEVYNQMQVEKVTFMQASAQGIVGRVDCLPPQELQNRWQQIWPQIGTELYYDFDNLLHQDYGTWHQHSFPRGFDLSKMSLTVEQFKAQYLDLPK